MLQGSPFRFVLTVLMFGLLPVSAWTQITPPKPGVALPEAYFERVREDRTAFQFQRAWFAEAKRVAENRRLRDRGLSYLAIDASYAISGTKRVPVLAGKFANTAVEPYTVAQLQAQLYDGPNPTGTVTDYYTEISLGNITLTGEVIGNGASLFQVSQNDTYYEGAAGCNGLCGTAKTGEYLKELLDGTDPGTDFGLYDNDGPDGLPNSGDDDGFVDFVAFVHPEKGGECGGDNLWSHRWVYSGWWGSAYTTDDPAAGGGFIKVSDYTIQPLLSCDGASLIEIGVYAHEFGHAFGLPDLYDTDSGNGTSAGIGEWGLMASGSWGGDGSHPERPSHMCAWSKEALGWVQPTILCGINTKTLNAVETSGEVAKFFPQGQEDTEYFLLEFRAISGFDQYIHTEGLAIWHIDNDNAGNGDENNKQVDLEEADGNFDLDNNTNRGDSGDLYPGSTNNITFDDLSVPDSKDNQGNPTGTITNISKGATLFFEHWVSECELRVSDVAVMDSSCSNNTGVLETGEKADLEICITNDFDVNRLGIRGILTSLTPKVSVLQDSVFYGAVGSGVTKCGSSLPFSVQVDSTVADGELLQFNLFLSNSSGSYTSNHTISLYAGNYVLLVEDDGAANYLASYTGPISTAGYTYVTHDTGADGTPGASAMGAALAVVWYTGASAENTFTVGEQDALTAFLDDGGRLYITGQDIGYDLWEQGNTTDKTFYQDYLHADYVSDTSSDNTLTGVSGDPIGDGVSFTLDGGISTWPSDIDARAGASEVFRYAPGKVGTIRWSTGHTLVYSAFSFEAIYSNNITNANTVMSRILDWLVPADITPPSATLTYPVGGETLDSCAQTAITWTASDDVAVIEVEILISADAGSTYSSLAIVPGNPGTYNWTPGIVGTRQLKIMARDAMGLQGVSQGSDFTLTDITPPTVTMVTPNGGESFAGGDNLNIEWDAADACSALDSTSIWISYDGGGAWNFIGMFPPAESTTVFLLPSTPSDSCLIRADAKDVAGNPASDESDAFWSITSIVGVGDFAGVDHVMLLQNAPNPFNRSTNIRFYLPEGGQVSLDIFDLNGRLVHQVENGVLGQGEHTLVWNGSNRLGTQAPAGIYFYVLRTPEDRLVRKLVRTH